MFVIHSVRPEKSRTGWNNLHFKAQKKEANPFWGLCSGVRLAVPGNITLADNWFISDLWYEKAWFRSDNIQICCLFFPPSHTFIFPCQSMTEEKKQKKEPNWVTCSVSCKSNLCFYISAVCWLLREIKKKKSKCWVFFFVFHRCCVLKFAVCTQRALFLPNSQKFISPVALDGRKRQKTVTKCTPTVFRMLCTSKKPWLSVTIANIPLVGVGVGWGMVSWSWADQTK